MPDGMFWQRTCIVFFFGTYVLSKLVISFPFDPVAGWQTSEQIFSGLIITENEQRKGNSWQPPVDLQGVHPKTLIHAWSVRQEDSQECFKEKSKVHNPILHALLKDR